MNEEIVHEPEDTVAPIARGPLTPRIKVIGAYPCSPYVIGDIITPNDNGSFCIIRTNPHNHGEWGDIAIFKPIAETAKYPALFSELNWYEFQDIKNMPEYVKGVFTKNVYKVVKWLDHPLRVRLHGAGSKMDVAYLYPATKEEYEAYIKSKTTNGNS